MYILLSLPVLSQNQQAPLPAAPSAEISYTLWLVGNNGEPETAAATTPLLRQQLAAAAKKSSAVFIGNPFYPQQLPKETNEKRPAAENKLKGQLAPLTNYPGQPLIIPGNYSSNKNKEVKAYRRQQRFISDYLKNEKIFQPENSCPGPAEIHLNKDLLLLLLDTKWLLPDNEITDEGSGCTVTQPSQVIAQVDDILRNYPEKHVVVAAHIPLDIKPVEYLYLRKVFARYFRQHPGLVFVEGSGGALRHSFSDSLHYLSAGTAAGKAKPTGKENLLFTNDTPGFAKINFYKTGEAWLEFWTAAAGDSAGQAVYRTLLMRKPTQAMLAAELKGKTFDFSDSTVTVRASTDYKAGGFRKGLMGKNYRPEWQQPITLPVFDIGKIQGGLTILQQGGGFQTRSLRLADAAGKEYVLRSVEKYPASALPRPLRKTIAAAIVKDQISASHPYGPLVVPHLSEAAGVYHTNPKYFYIPDDPRFGKYRTGFANTLGLFEERPDDDQSDAPYFGNSKKVTSTAKVLENLQEDNDNSVDQKAVVRARLFDFFLGDWDRHDDQWRWASFEKEGEKGKVYQPIPRDRDMAFFVNQGAVPNIASRKWLLPKIQGFDESIRDIQGFNFNARYFDRTFLTALSLADWLEAADKLKNSLSDAEIEQAVRQLPESVFNISGPGIIRDLKARRDALPKNAADYYKFLAREVDVVGSDKNELFEVVRQDDENTIVTVRKISKSGQPEQVLYQRQFKTGETREVRLYGLEGEDEFKVSGNVNKGIKVRIIGGDDADVITDESAVAGWSKKTFVYDTPKDNKLNLGRESKNLISQDKDINDYNRKAFVYDYMGPLGSVEYNRDNGVLIGVGTAIKTQGFKKEPFAASHRFLARYALLTRSFQFDYQGYFTEFVKKFDLQVNLDVRTPNFNTTFFGLGNESVFNQSRNIEFYRYTSRQYYFNALLGRKIGKKQVFLAGPSFQSVDINFTPNRFITSFANGNQGDQQFFQAKTYGGLEFRYQLNTRDNANQPTKGLLVNLGSGLYSGLSSGASNFNRLAGDISFFHTFRIPLRLTVGNRVGGAKNYGNYEFFQANRLDGNSNLRGYRQNRFAGGSTFYNNTDVRIKLFNFQTYLFPGSLGIIGFHDIGRVWEKGQNSSRWHTGYGGGIWISPINLVVISAEYAISKETRLPLIRAGFLF